MKKLVTIISAITFPTLFVITPGDDASLKVYLIWAVYAAASIYGLYWSTKEDGNNDRGVNQSSASSRRDTGICKYSNPHGRWS